jgi:hypothetical protein
MGVPLFGRAGITVSHFVNPPCLVQGRQLLASFPLDTKLEDGSPFWQSPKRPPAPLHFDPSGMFLGLKAGCNFLTEHTVTHVRLLCYR